MSEDALFWCLTPAGMVELVSMWGRPPPMAKLKLISPRPGLLLPMPDPAPPYPPLLATFEFGAVLPRLMPAADWLYL